MKAYLNKEDTAIFNFFGRKQNNKSMMEAVEEARNDPAIRVVDVRTRGEYAAGHIPGALCLPMDELKQAQSKLPDKDTPLYLYCASGARSGMAVGMLRRMGYEQCYNIGGIYSYAGELER